MSRILVRTILCVPLIVSVQGAVRGRRIIKENIFNDFLDLVEGTTSTMPSADSSGVDAKNSCEDKSLFVRQDLEAIVDYVYGELKLNDNITESYLPKAIKIKNKYLNQLEIFDKWFKHQPEHLTHIIDDLADRRKAFTPKVADMSRVLDNYQMIHDTLIQKQNELDELSLKIKRFRNICDANCPAAILQMSARKDYYCGTAAELKTTATSVLTNHATNVIQPALLNKIENLNEKYGKIIADLELDIKNIALSDYGHLLVDILRIYDDYIHYYQLFNTDIEAYLLKLKEILPGIDVKLSQLRAVVEKYRKHCLECVSPMVLSLIDVKQKDVESDQKDNLLYTVINSKIKNIEEQSFLDIANLFACVDKAIEEIKVRNTNVANFKPVQDHVKKQLQTEVEAFNGLNVMASKDSVQKFLALEDMVSKLDANIQSTLVDVKNRLNLK